MFSFTAQGRIGQIKDLAKGGVRISIAADRLAEGPDGAYTRTEWLSVLSFDPEIVKRIDDELEVGQSVKITGRVEPRKRMVDDKPVYDTSFFILSFERLSKPTPKAKSKSADTEAAPAL